MQQSSAAIAAIIPTNAVVSQVLEGESPDAHVGRFTPDGKCLVSLNFVSTQQLASSTARLYAVDHLKLYSCCLAADHPPLRMLKIVCSGQLAQQTTAVQAAQQACSHTH
jgi:hypothetical protein